MEFMKWTNPIISIANKLTEMICVMTLLREMLDYKVIKT